MSKRGAHENLGAVRALLSVRIMESPSSIKWLQVNFELQSLMGLFRKETLPHLAVLNRPQSREEVCGTTLQPPSVPVHTSLWKPFYPPMTGHSSGKVGPEG